MPAWVRGRMMSIKELLDSDFGGLLDPQKHPKVPVRTHAAEYVPGSDRGLEHESERSEAFFSAAKEVWK